MRSEVNEILEIQRWCGKGGQKTFDEKRQVTFGYTDNDNQIGKSKLIKYAFSRRATGMVGGMHS